MNHPRRPFTGRWPWLSGGVALVLVLSSPAKGFDLSGVKATVHVEIGQGEGTFQVFPDRVELSGKATQLSTYDDNLDSQLCLLNYLFSDPLPLSPQSTSISLSVDSPAANASAALQLRLIMRDADNRLWAVGTRLASSRSRLVTTNGFEPIVSYRWNATEIDRLDRWVAAPLDPTVTHDGSLLMKLPVRLDGFQVGMGAAARSFRIGIKNIEENPLSVKPDPYWLITSQPIWNLRLASQGKPSSSFGFGDAAPIPALRASTLNLAPGDYQVSWEILAADEWTLITSGTGPWKVGTSGSDVWNLPLLPRGSYQLRLCCIKDGAPPREFAFSYVVVRNDRPFPLHAPAGSPADPLAWSSSSPGGNIWSAATGASLTVKASIKEAGAPHIDWKIESSDGIQLDAGSQTSDRAILNLEPLFHHYDVLWITAVLSVDGRVKSVSHRVVGLASAPPQEARLPLRPKVAWYHGAFRRTKGDWEEGATPVATQASQVNALLGPWLDEAKQTGYNTVELSAPWYDLNPLPRVYQFEYLDRLVTAAEKRGLAVTLRVHPQFRQTPSWVPRELMEDEGGFVHGLWSGASALLYSPASQVFSRSLDDFLEALGAHYRGDPMMLGVTLEGLYFDHDLADMPWCDQNVDYSETMRQSFIAALKIKYRNDLTKAARAHAVPYRSWAEIEIPHPHVQFDGAGRLRPRTDAPWRDWVEHKVGTIRDFHLAAARALRRGDPASYAGFYTTDTSPLYLDEIRKENDELANGSMENQFPPADTGIPTRFEPSAKISKWPTLADVGMSNVLLAGAPGSDSFFNYWMLSKTLGTVGEPERSAEQRLKRWFAATDSLTDAKEVGSEDAGKGCYLTGFLPLLYSLQHTFTGRAEDVNNPFIYRIGEDHVSMKPVSTKALSTSLKQVTYLYVPFWNDVVEPETVAQLKRYVEQGGTLILEGTSGFWNMDSTQEASIANALGAAFQLPPAVPATSPLDGPGSEVASWTAQMPDDLRAAPVSFRVRPFASPVNDQATPWIQNIPHAYLRPYRLAGILRRPALTAATFADGSPAAVLRPFGKGRVLFFCGTIDWIDCAGLGSALNAWATGTQAGKESLPDSPLILRMLQKGDDYFLIGRRSIDQDALAKIGIAAQLPVKAEAVMSVRFSQPLPVDRSFKVRELISQTDLGTFSGAQLSGTGVTLSLRPGEGFILQAAQDSPTP